MNVNEIDYQKLHLLPKPFQFVLALCLAGAVGAFGYFAVFQDQITEWEASQAKETELRNEYEMLSVRAASLKNLELELESINSSIEQLIKQLPTSSEIPTLIQELYQAAATNNLRMSTVIPMPMVSEDANIDRMPFQISVIGSYKQLSEFMRAVGRMSRIVTLSSINIEPVTPWEDVLANGASEAFGINKTKAQKRDNRLKLSAIASTYKAVDAPAQASSASAASGAEAASAAQ